VKKKFDEFKQGLFTPLNKKKCLNKGEIVFRSSLELKMMMKLDSNSNVLEWSSEQVVIPYLKPGPIPKMARYFVDFYFKIKIGDGTEKKFLVEIKPLKQTKAPTVHGNKKKTTLIYEQYQYCVNQSKWKAAKEWCIEKSKKDNSKIEFIILTEKEIDKLLSVQK
jgi:hypothetical protein